MISESVVDREPGETRGFSASGRLTEGEAAGHGLPDQIAGRIGLMDQGVGCLR